MIEIITVNSFRDSDIEILKQQLGDKIIELNAFPIYPQNELNYINLNGLTEHLEQRYILKIRTNISNVTFCDPYVYFFRLKCYTADGGIKC